MDFSQVRWKRVSVVIAIGVLAVLAATTAYARNREILHYQLPYRLALTVIEEKVKSLPFKTYDFGENYACVWNAACNSWPRYRKDNIGFLA